MFLGFFHCSLRTHNKLSAKDRAHPLFFAFRATTWVMLKHFSQLANTKCYLYRPLMQISLYGKHAYRWPQLHHSHAQWSNYRGTWAEQSHMRGLCLRDHVRSGWMETQEVSYPGHSIDVLLTKQWLKTQHCTLGKRESQQSGRRNAEKCLHVGGGIRRHEMRAEKMRRSGKRLTSWGAWGEECVWKVRRWREMTGLKLEICYWSGIVTEQTVKLDPTHNKIGY